jgi:hypothetical protein
LPNRRVIVESWANLIARVGLSLAVLSTVWLCLALSTFGEASATRDATEYADGLVSTGYTTYLVGVNEGANAKLTPDDCRALSAVPGVKASVWLGPDTTVRLWSTAGQPLVVRAAGGDVGPFLAMADPAAAAKWHGQSVLLDRANPIATAATGDIHVRWIDAGRRATVTLLGAHLTSAGGGQEGNAWLLAAPPSSVKTCVARVDEEARAQVAATVAAAFPASHGYSGQWALPNADAFEAPRARFESRVAQYFWLAGVLVAATVWALYLRLRRAEIAVYAVAGLSARQLWIMIGTELATLIASACALLSVSVGGLAATHALARDSLAVGVRSGARCLMAVTLCGLVLAAWAASNARSSTLDALKDR